MRQPFRFAAVTAAAIAFLLAAGSPSSAVTIPGWYSSTDVSAQFNTGNSETINVGVTTNITRQWLRTSWKTTGSFVRSDVHEPTRQAIQTGGGFSFEKGPRVTKSEKIFVNSLFERRITERFFWNVGGTGERDVFAGLKSRLIAVAGVGYLWQNQGNTANFKGSIGATYTAQKDVIEEVPDKTEDNFAGVRLSLGGEKRFGDQNQHSFTSELIVDENVQTTDDLRFNWQNALAASISRKLALKVGVQLAFDNLPQLVQFPLGIVGSDGVFREVDPAVQIASPAKKLDVAATVSLVINITPGGGGASRPGTPSVGGSSTAKQRAASRS
jgi:hypothetical protein